MENSIPEITIVNLTAAAMIAQFSIVVIFVAGLFFLRSGASAASRFPYETGAMDLSWLLLLGSVASLGALLLAEQFASIWKPVFGHPDFDGLPLSRSVLIAFGTDALLTSLLVHQTGGTRSSPFATMFFIYSPLAIFLRQPLRHVLFYGILVILLFTINIWWFASDPGRRVTSAWREAAEREGNQLSFWFVSVAAFALTTTIGVITRPA